MLTDEQCNEFRSLPVSFNDMVRAIHADGYAQALKDAAEVCGKLEEEELCLDVSSDEGKHGYAHERLAQAAAAILALGKENP